MKQLDSIINKIASGKYIQFWIFFSVLVLLSAMMVYLYTPFCPGHDSYFHFRRMQALMEGINNPYLIYLDYTAIEGYGYFTKAFYSDFLLIPFALLGKATGVDFAYQSLLFVMTVLCGLFTYMSVNRIYKNRYAAATSALLYTFCLYRLLDIYQRGALGEAISFTFVPLVFWGVYEILHGDYKKKWYILTIGFSLLVLTHAIASLLMFITIVIVMLVYYKSFVKEPKRLSYLVLAGVVTLAISAYYILPMLEQTLSNTFYYQTNPLTSLQENLLSNYSIIKGLFAGFIYPMQVFIPGTGLILTCAIILRLFVYNKSAALKSVDIGVLIGFIYIVMTWYFFPWKIFPFNKLEIIQMPWRLLEFSSYFFAVAGGFYLSQLSLSRKKLLIAGFIIVAAISIVMVNDSKLYHDSRCSLGIKREALAENRYHLIGLEYLPEKVPSIEYIIQRGDNITAGNKETRLSNLSKRSGITSVDITISGKDQLEMPLVYYKGYKATLNNAEVTVLESANGLVEIPVDKSGRVEVYYAGTVVQRTGFITTILAILALCLYISVRNRRSKKQKL